MSALLAAMGINFASNFLKGVDDSNKASVQAQNSWQQANIYRRNAALVRLSGARNEDALRSQNRAVMARAATAGGEAGMGESETFASALASTAARMEQNVLNSRYQTESEAMNYLYQANVAEAAAHQQKKKSKNLFNSGLINGIYSAFNVYNG